MLGKRVRFQKASGKTMPPALVGATGVVSGEKSGENPWRWHVTLDDQHIPGFSTKKAWALTEELEVLD